MTYDQFVDLLAEITEDPNQLPDTGDEVEDLILSVANNLNMSQFAQNLPALILSVMLHQAALQGCINMMSQGEDVRDIFEPTVH